MDILLETITTNDHGVIWYLRGGGVWQVLLALLIAALVSFAATPLVKVLSVKWGAIDVPKDDRRMHDHPIPRMGGLAIFMGFLAAVLLLVPLDIPKKGMLLGSIVIVILGVFDDKYALSARLKFVVQIIAALIAAFAGNRVTVLSNPFSSSSVWQLGWLSWPVTVIWIVAVTNAVNLIDGLDGLACGVSTISSTTMLIIALLVSETDVAVVMAALAGACIGFLPFNFNPANIFMGDTGATFLGYIMATMSVQGMFKMAGLISFVVPFLVLGLPIFDVTFAVIRRVSHGQNPMTPDRGHIHHRLIDMGFSQKQAVGVLYLVSAILGLSAVVLTVTNFSRALLFLIAMGIAVLVAWQVFRGHEKALEKQRSAAPEERAEEPGPAGPEPSSAPAEAPADSPEEEKDDG